MKLRCSYHESIAEVEALTPDQLERVHGVEFQHAALTLALAITNGCKEFLCCVERIKC